MPAYELALMTAHRAKAAGREMQVMVITPEDEPLAALGVSVGAEVGMLLEEVGITLVTGVTALIREPGRIEIHPMRGSLAVDRIIALPELYAPPVRGVPTSAERGFVSVDGLGAVPGLERVYAAGDITDAPVKHGALAGEMADVVANTIASLAGADIEPRPAAPGALRDVAGCAGSAVHPLAGPRASTARTSRSAPSRCGSRPRSCTPSTWAPAWRSSTPSVLSRMIERSCRSRATGVQRSYA